MKSGGMGRFGFGSTDCFLLTQTTNLLLVKEGRGVLAGSLLQESVRGLFFNHIKKY
jgi:hypothetical protein